MNRTGLNEMQVQHISTDPYGQTLPERILSRMAGAGVAALVLAIVFARWNPMLGWFAVGILYGVVVPLSLVMVRYFWARGASFSKVVLRHALLGGVVFAVVVLVMGVISALSGEPETLLWLPLLLSFGFLAGAAAGAITAAVGMLLRARLVLFAAALAGLLAIGALGAGQWWQQQPKVTTSYIEVLAPSEQTAEQKSAYEIAQLVAVEYERVAPAGEYRLSNEAFFQVAEEINRIGIFVNAGLGREVIQVHSRQITVQSVDDFACVIVTETGTDVSQGVCPDR
ncbi:hypothetical protein [Dethiobacter alkaliphilus]|uniref:hypothetical protein n=1 Tax=Dethiobacter alkaliphilus TaxID=427926 RepID=UPI0022261010|nr:hypothetical protein [Dethiobacter alkaliphilus]MCW3489480.1 hypothetical protein [Dethiobacter alkaliphilus]